MGVSFLLLPLVQDLKLKLISLVETNQEKLYSLKESVSGKFYRTVQFYRSPVQEFLLHGFSDQSSALLILSLISFCA